MPGSDNFSMKKRRIPSAESEKPASKRCRVQTMPQQALLRGDRPRRKMSGGSAVNHVVVKVERAEPLKEKKANVLAPKVESESEDEGPDMSDYERIRLKNLQDNADFFAKLGINEAKEEIRLSSKSSTTQLKPRPIKRERVKMPAEPRRASLRLAKLDPDGAPLPEDYLKKIEPPVEEHPRKPCGPLLMKEYLGFNCEEKEHDDLIERVKTCFSCKSSKTKSKPDTLDSFVKDLSKLKINANQVAKVVPNRVFSLDIHPSNTKVLTAAGDKWGFLGLWDLKPDRQHQSDGVVVYTPHSRPINCVQFSTYQDHHLYSCSYDGTMRCCDLQKGVFDEVYSVPDEEGLLLKGFDFLSADTMLVSQQDGCVALVDRRTNGCSAEHEYPVHQKSLRTVSVHPVKKDIFCTSCTDNTVCIWDIRKLNSSGKNKPVAEYSHGRSVNSAYFSPVTGKYILSTSVDDRIFIYNCENLTCLEREHSIVHDNHVGRWLTGFRAAWHPAREDVFTVGSMSKPRQIDIFGSDGKRLYTMKNEEFLGSVCSLVVFSKSQNVLVGANSSGRLHLFKQ